MATLVKVFSENRGSLNGAQGLQEQSGKDRSGSIPQRGAVVLQPFHAFFAVVMQHQPGISHKTDVGTFAFDLLINEGNALAYIGKQFLDLLIASGQAAREESNRAREEYDFVERQQLKRLNDIKKIEVRLISDQQSFLQQILNYYKSGTAFHVL